MVLCDCAICHLLHPVKQYGTLSNGDKVVHVMMSGVGKLVVVINFILHETNPYQPSTYTHLLSAN